MVARETEYLIWLVIMVALIWYSRAIKYHLEALKPLHQLRTVICPDFLIMLIYCRDASSITVGKTTNQQFIKKVLKLLMNRQITHVFCVFLWEITCAWHQSENTYTKKWAAKKAGSSCTKLLRFLRASSWWAVSVFRCFLVLLS